MKTETIDNVILELRRTFPVSRERLFAAWTEPCAIRQWFGPDGVRILDAKMDVRPGGKYVISATGSTDEIWTVVGEYREIASPSRLAFTWRWDDDSDWEGVNSVVTVEFNEQPGGSELHLIHRGFPSTEHRGRHEHGWSGSLVKLARYLVRSDDATKHGAFSWSELITTDPKAALDFYTKLFGWNTEVMHMEGMDYTIVKSGDRAIGGVMKAPEGAPVGWKAYVTVDNIDETVILAQSLGAKICIPPTDIPDVGRFAILIDPQGAVIAAITYVK